MSISTLWDMYLNKINELCNNKITTKLIIHHIGNTCGMFMGVECRLDRVSQEGEGKVKFLEGNFCSFFLPKKFSLFFFHQLIPFLPLRGLYLNEINELRDVKIILSIAVELCWTNVTSQRVYGGVFVGWGRGGGKKNTFQREFFFLFFFLQYIIFIFFLL